MQRRVRFNRVPEKVPEKVPRGIGAEAGQVQQGSGEGSREGLGGFGAEPGHVQQVPENGEGSGRLWQSQVRFNRVPEKVPKVPEKVWEALVRARSGSTGSTEFRSFRRRFWRSS